MINEERDRKENPYYLESEDVVDALPDMDSTDFFSAVRPTGIGSHCTSPLTPKVNKVSYGWEN